jgi:hypothetical protein
MLWKIKRLEYLKPQIKIIFKIITWHYGPIITTAGGVVGLRILNTSIGYDDILRLAIKVLH